MPESDCAYHTHAHAKLNLALAVGGAIDDPASPVHGYHPICSYMHAIDLCDRVEIQRRREGQGSEYDIAWGGQGGDRAPVRWAMEHDLAARAHRAMEASVGRARPARLRITSRKRRLLPRPAGAHSNASRGCRPSITARPSCTKRSCSQARPTKPTSRPTVVTSALGS